MVKIDDRETHLGYGEMPAWATKPRNLGDLPGHEFHGNQYTQGHSGSEKKSDGKKSSRKKDYEKEQAEAQANYEKSHAKEQDEYEQFMRDSGFDEDQTEAFYHGTASQAIERIKREGLLPNGGKGADEWAKQFGEEEFGAPPPPEMFDRAPAVFLTPDSSEAERFARYAARVNPGSSAVVLEVDVPRDQLGVLENDDQMPDAVRSLKRIPPTWIKGKLNRYGQLEALAAKDNTVKVYVVVLVDNNKPMPKVPEKQK